MNSSWHHIHYITSVILYIYSRYVTAFEYYVTAAPNGVPCNRTDLPRPCHNLSYYTANYKYYFTDDKIFYFLEGTHTLQDTLEISNVSNITLQGLGHIEQGFHETVMQSTSVIMCSDYKNSGIQFNNSTDIVLKSLTIANCGFCNFISDQPYTCEANVSLFFVDSDNVTLEWVSVQNGSAYGLCLVDAFDVLIVDSTFANNGHPKHMGGNALIIYDNDRFDRPATVNILQSNFTLSLVSGMEFLHYSGAVVVIEKCHFSHNVFFGGVYIVSHGIGGIAIRNCTMYNNTATISGGGVSISLFGNGRLEFDNCTIYNNTAQQSAGGVFIRSFGNSSIDFSNCIIYNNTALAHGGGIFLVSNGSRSTEFCNCAIHNNNADITSGMILYATGSFHFTNVLFHSNSVTNKLDVYKTAVLIINVNNVFLTKLRLVIITQQV